MVGIYVVWFGLVACMFVVGCICGVGLCWLGGFGLFDCVLLFGVL